MTTRQTLTKPTLDTAWMNLTPRQEAFAKAYVDGGCVSASAAARQVGVTTGHGWLRHPRVRDYIALMLQDVCEDADYGPGEWLAEVREEVAVLGDEIAALRDRIDEHDDGSPAKRRQLAVLDSLVDRKLARWITLMELVGKHVDVGAFAADARIVGTGLDFAAEVRAARERGRVITIEPGKNERAQLEGGGGDRVEAAEGDGGPSNPATISTSAPEPNSHQFTPNESTDIEDLL